MCRSSCKGLLKITHTHSSARPETFNYGEVTEDSDNYDHQVNDRMFKVKFTYHNDVHFESVNTRMHIRLTTESNMGTIQVDTGMDGNLLPKGEF